MSIDVQRLRAEFPTLQHKAYINSGSYGLLAIEVQQAFERYLADRLECGADWGKWVQLYEDVRQRVALLLGASTDEIAVTASASAGLNALASALSYADGRDKIVVSDFEFPTSGQIWHAQERAGARVEHVPENAQGYIPLEAFERAIDELAAAASELAAAEAPIVFIKHRRDTENRGLEGWEGFPPPAPPSASPSGVRPRSRPASATRPGAYRGSSASPRRSDEWIAIG